MTERTARRSDFAVCPHCWHVNGPLSRICLRCGADMLLRLQESGGRRWTAAVQSPVPVRGTHRLTRAQRALLFGFVVIFGLGQLLYAFTPQRSADPERASAPQPPRDRDESP